MMSILHKGGHLYCRHDTAVAVVGAGPEFGETEARWASSFSAYFCSGLRPDPHSISRCRYHSTRSSEKIKSGIGFGCDICCIMIFGNHKKTKFANSSDLEKQKLRT